MKPSPHGCERRSLRSLVRDSDGTALVEGAIVLPVLMTLLLGVYEFSFYFYQQQLITTGVRDAARYLARFDLTACSASSTMSTANCPVQMTTDGGSTYTYVVTDAKNIVVYGSASSSGSPRVTGLTTAAISASLADDANSGATTPCGTSPCNGGTTSGTSYVQVVTVTATFSDPTLGFLGFLGLSTPTITVSHSERVVGVG